MLRTKSVHSPIDPATDGLRILATRLRGRGMKSDRYDVWMANLGPSERLLRGALRSLGENHGQKFTLRLLKRLAEKENVTVMCHCAEEEQHCHRHLLKELILRS